MPIARGFHLNTQLIYFSFLANTQLVPSASSSQFPSDADALGTRLGSVPGCVSALDGGGIAVSHSGYLLYLIWDFSSSSAGRADKPLSSQTAAMGATS